MMTGSEIVPETSVIFSLESDDMSLTSNSVETSDLTADRIIMNGSSDPAVSRFTSDKEFKK
jgi:hypothetical protein